MSSAAGTTVAPPVVAEPGMKELAIVVAIAWTLVQIPASILGGAMVMGEAMRLGHEAGRTGVLDVNEMRNLIWGTMGSPLILIVASASDAIVTLSAVWYFGCRQFGRSFVEGVGLRRSRWAIPSVAIGLLLAAGASFVPDQGTSGIHSMTQGAGGFYTFLALALLLPFLEEVYYRGFLFPILTRRFGAAVAIPVIVLWFTAIHVPQLMPQWLLIGYIGVVAIVLTVQRHVTASLLPPLITHLTYNAALVALAMVDRFTNAVAPS